MNTKLKGMLLVILGASMWGIMGVFVRGLYASGYSTYDVSFVRCFLAGIVFLLIKAMKQPEILKVDKKGLIVCIMYGIVAYGFSFVTYGISVERIPVAVAIVLMFMSTIWVTLLGILVFKEKLRKETIVTIIICIFGAALVSNLVGVSAGCMDIIGILTGIMNGFGVALQIMIPRYFSEKYEKDTMLIYGFLGASLMLAFFTDFSLIRASLGSPEAGSILWNLFGVGILCTLVANGSFVKSTQYINTTTSSILAAIEVVVGAGVGYLFFNEKLTALQIIGAIIVIIGSLGSTILESLRIDKHTTKIKNVFHVKKV